MSRIHVANYGIDPLRDGAVAARRSADRSILYDAVFVGRFHAQKGLADLITVWRIVQEQMPEARLAVIGAGAGQAAVTFTRQIDTLNPGTVVLLGVLTGEPKYVAMARSRVLLFPSHHESWGLVALEAMAVGLPVIGYDLPSSKEAFGDAMVLIESYDTRGFAAAALRLINDPAIGREYRRRGYRVAKRYNWEMIASRFAEDVMTTVRGFALTETRC